MTVRLGSNYVDMGVSVDIRIDVDWSSSAGYVKFRLSGFGALASHVNAYIKVWLGDERSIAIDFYEFVTVTPRVSRRDVLTDEVIGLHP